MKKISGVELVEGIIQADHFNLGRFIRAQQEVYTDALAELRNGRKRTHWMWFIFPQIEGLGHGASSIRYAIKTMEEARHYLAHPILGKRLLECAKTVFAIEGRTISEIFGFPDDRKFQSCMTLFEFVAGSNSIFAYILDKFYGGERDKLILQLI